MIIGSRRSIMKLSGAQSRKRMRDVDRETAGMAASMAGFVVRRPHSPARVSGGASPTIGIHWYRVYISVLGWVFDNLLINGGGAPNHDYEMSGPGRQPRARSVRRPWAKQRLSFHVLTSIITCTSIIVVPKFNGMPYSVNSQLPSMAYH